jgi:hypothetical protein
MGGWLLLRLPFSLSRWLRRTATGRFRDPSAFDCGLGWDDGVGYARARASATATADPYGMTNKRASNCNCNCNRKCKCNCKCNCNCYRKCSRDRSFTCDWNPS